MTEAVVRYTGNLYKNTFRNGKKIMLHRLVMPSGKGRILRLESDRRFRILTK